VAFGLGALIPLVPFLVGSGTAAVVASAALSIVALFAVGAATSIFTGRHAGRSGLRMALIGASVATITFLIGSAIGTSV
jgi:VIT1/CCC1 family predicted Fe2+/Mn2+ transporter